MKVDFLIAGTEPAGINQLYFLLSHHAKICLPPTPQPEPNFFSKDVEYGKGVDYYHGRFFSHFAGQEAVGEKSGRYLWHPGSAKRIHAYNPSMRLIFILRDPIQRAFSNYRFSCLSGIETLPFAAALEQEDVRREAMAQDPKWRDVQPYAYYEKGLYARQLERFFELFPPDQIHVLRNDQLRDDTCQTVEAVLRFLDLSTEDYTHVEESPAYTSFHIRSMRVQWLLRSVSPAFLDRVIMKKREGSRAGFLERVAQLNLTNDRPPLPEQVVTSLRKRYREEMQALAKVVPFSIEDWM